MTLLELQSVLKEILYVIDDFCKEYNVKYFLVGGTLLGAIRHHDIIPWDDDADIGMIRPEFDRFVQLFSKNTPKGYKIYSYPHTKGFFYPFAKICKDNTLSEEPYNFVPRNMGVSVDLLPWDGCPGDILESQVFFEKYGGGDRVMNFLQDRFSSIKNVSGVRNKWHYIKRQFVNCKKHKGFSEKITYLFRKIDKKRINKDLQSFITTASQYNIMDCKYSSCVIWGLYGKGEVQLTESFIKLESAQFGERRLPVPSGWHDYLSGIYGDYMTPPSNPSYRHIRKNGPFILE